MNQKPPKPFLTYQQQIQKLSQEKHLNIRNEADARLILENICYYTLIDGYKDLFYNPMTRKYKSETCLEDLLTLYTFDESLRGLFFKYLCHIEQKMRSLISYYFSEKYSPLPSDYLNPHNYNYIPKFQNQIQYLLNKILTFEATHNMQHAYVVYQRNTYGCVPLWVLMNTLTYGQISKMYTYLNTSVQSRIRTHFVSVSEKELGQFLKTLTNFRNVCAHNERLFAYRSNTAIPDKALHMKLEIPKKGTAYQYGKNDLFAVAIAFRYLLPKTDFLLFKQQLFKLIRHCLKNSPALTETALLNAMGFPENWDSITHYKP